MTVFGGELDSLGGGSESKEDVVGQIFKLILKLLKLYEVIKFIVVCAQKKMICT